jgi:glycosyltransferase involved in cell wall biosynthesis
VTAVGSRVSVVIPACNVERWLGGAIESVLDQDARPAEVIVVDDGSSDGTADVARSFPDVTLVRQDNRGLAGARNAGAARATGDAVLFLDADDMLLPGALRELVATLDRDARVAAVVPNFVVMEERGERVAWPHAPRLRVLGRQDLRRLLPANPLAANALVRREAWRSLGFREELRAAEDLDLWIRLLLAGRSIAMIGTPLVRVRARRPGALTRRPLLMRSSRRRVFASLWGRRDLTPVERGLVGYQLARTTLGILLARAEPRRAAGLACVQVRLREPGGGPTHVRILREGLGDRVEWREVVLDPGDLRSPGFGLLEAVAEVLRATRPGAIVHAHGVRSAAVAIPAAILRRAPLVVTVHGLHSLRRSPGVVSTWVNRAVLGRARRVLVLSGSDRAEILDAGLAPAGRVVLVRAAVGPVPFVPRAAARRALGLPSRSLVVTSLARLSPQKDPLTFCRAVHALSGRRKVVGVLAGDGPMAPDVRREVGADGGALRSVGWVDDPADLLGASDVFVSTSRWEGLPLAALEAASAGLPLVLTDVPGNRDLVEMGVPAILVPAGDADAVASAIATLTPQTRRTMGAGAAEAVRRTFCAGGLAEDVLAVYRGLATGDGPT